ncbi:hypothetical protein [Eggerthella sp. YY7918]|nr:hypothetical protein [Eggerthella sp. YY7918]BAK45930.1 hypothetical protein EGYY_29660 [Eggerthella sp. YY7918]
MITANALPVLLLTLSLVFIVALVVVGCALVKLNARVKELEGIRQ